MRKLRLLRPAGSRQAFYKSLSGLGNQFEKLFNLVVLAMSVNQ